MPALASGEATASLPPRGGQMATPVGGENAGAGGSGSDATQPWAGASIGTAASAAPAKISPRPEGAGATRPVETGWAEGGSPGGRLRGKASGKHFRPLQAAVHALRAPRPGGAGCPVRPRAERPGTP